jgi:hypothetical protein
MKTKSILFGLFLLLFSLAGISQDTTRNSSTIIQGNSATHKQNSTAIDTSTNANTTGSVNGTMPNNPDPGSVTTNPQGKTASSNGVVNKTNNTSTTTNVQNNINRNNGSSPNSSSTTNSSTSSSSSSTNPNK